MGPKSVNAAAFCADTNNNTFRLLSLQAPFVFVILTLPPPPARSPCADTHTLSFLGTVLFGRRYHFSSPPPPTQKKQKTKQWRAFAALVATNLPCVSDADVCKVITSKNPQTSRFPHALKGKKKKRKEKSHDSTWISFNYFFFLSLWADSLLCIRIYFKSFCFCLACSGQ